MHAGQGQPIGDFAAIISFAEWTKCCGFGQIHIHREQRPSPRKRRVPISRVIDGHRPPHKSERFEADI
jgi:hypothetical protein